MSILGTIISLVAAFTIVLALVRWLWPRLKPDWMVTPSEVFEAVAMVWYQNTQIMKALDIEVEDEQIEEAKAVLEAQGYTFND